MAKSTEVDLRKRLLLLGGGGLLLLLFLVGFTVVRFCFDRVAGDFFYPYLELARQGRSALSDLTLLGYSRRELAAKLEESTRSNRELALRASSAAELLRENEKLRQLCRLPGSTQWNYIPSEILLRDPVLWQERFTLNRGTVDGVLPGAAVVDLSPDGRVLLVGLVDRAGQRSCRVATLLDPGLRLSARIGSSGAIGVVNAGERRRGGGRVPLGLLPAHVRYTPGEVVVTTGFERKMPGGIQIGTLVETDPAGSIYSDVLQLSGTLAPAADFASLRFPVIVTSKLPVAP